MHIAIISQYDLNPCLKPIGTKPVTRVFRRGVTCIDSSGPTAYSHLHTALPSLRTTSGLQQNSNQINAVCCLILLGTIWSLNMWLVVKLPPLSNASVHRKTCRLCKLQEVVKPVIWRLLFVKITSSHTFILDRVQWYPQAVLIVSSLYIFYIWELQRTKFDSK